VSVFGWKLSTRSIQRGALPSTDVCRPPSVSGAPARKGLPIDLAGLAGLEGGVRLRGAAVRVPEAGGGKVLSLHLN
jgi:hypothetical protein